jgi:hypothetical protein
MLGADFLGRLIIAFVPAVIAAGTVIFVARRLATHQHHTQKWWELKAHRYSESIEALAKIHYTLVEWQRREVEGIEHGDAYERTLSDAYSEGVYRVNVLAYSGAFIISPTASEAIGVLAERLGNRGESGQWLPKMNTDSLAVRDCLETVRQEAHADLKQKPAL